jgi:hypothetical protein
LDLLAGCFALTEDAAELDGEPGDQGVQRPGEAGDRICD